MKAKNSTRRSRRQHRKRRVLRFQSLESRTMLDASTALSNLGVLTIDAGSEAADIGVFELWGRVVVTSRDVSGTSHYHSFNRDQVKEIVFSGSSLADKFSNTTGIADSIYGGGGDDVLSGGRAKSYVRGGAGHDTINGGAGSDQIYGDDGNDKINGDDGNDEIHGGDGNDMINGGAGNDRLYGDRGKDTLNGGDGTDRIYGGDGDDTIFGGGGDDTLYGNDGSDHVYGDGFMCAQGADHLLGGDGEDWLYGGGGNDTIEGQGWDDHLYGGGGNDRLLGGYGHDELFGDGGVDELVGGPGADYFDGGAMRDTLVDVSSNDTVQKTLRAQLTIDSLYAIEASDGQPWGSTNEVYFMVSGLEGGVPFGPVRCDPAGRDYWSLDTGDRAENICLWHGDLKPGECVDFIVTMFDHDNASWDALRAFGEGLLTSLPAIPSMLTGNFLPAMGIAVNSVAGAVNDAIKAGATGGDDLLGVFLVHVENIDGRIATTWRAASQTIKYEVAETSAGDTANFRTWCSDGEFFVRASVLEA